MFKFLLRLAHGEPNDPAVLVTAVPNWTVGETFSTGRGHEWRILTIDTDIADELVEQGINAVFTVVPALIAERSRLRFPTSLRPARRSAPMASSERTLAQASVPR